MKRGTIIIPPKKTNIPISEKDIAPTNERHAEFMRDYANIYGLDIEIAANNPFYWGKAYMEKGIMNLQIDRESIIYLPETIDEQQYYWYQENKKMLRRLRLRALSCYEDEGTLRFIPIEDYDTELVIEMIEEDLEEKFTNYQNKKREEKKECHQKKLIIEAID